jgi:phytoene/squalene synthetase
MKTQPLPNVPEARLPAEITKAASRQTYYTMRLLADRGRVQDAMRSYAYFRWVDDMLDAPGASEAETSEFILRQERLLAACWRGDFPRDADRYERMLVELVRGNRDAQGGLRTYLGDMMAVMSFDAWRRGRLIGAGELGQYTRDLARAVTENLHYFIGHGCAAPRDGTRYLVVEAAHITHMLRDTLEDVQAGYYNIPREVLEAGGIGPEEIHAPAYRAWVKGRVRLARGCFERGRDYLRRVESRRCRLAGFAYIARFEGVLDAIEREEYYLRAGYPERKGLRGILWACGSALGGSLVRHGERVPVEQRAYGRAAGATAARREERLREL